MLMISRDKIGTQEEIKQRPEGGRYHGYQGYLIMIQADYFFEALLKKKADSTIVYLSVLPSLDPSW